MKKLSTISLFIFSVMVTAILVAGLVFYQNNKNNQTTNTKSNSLIQSAISKNGTVVPAVTSKINPNTGSATTKKTPIPNPVKKTLVLNMTEIAKHNKSTDCWMLISGKVYDITSFFGSHPGGNSTMSTSCGKDATDAYDTKDPYATSTSGGRGHSSRAQSMLGDYYIGNFNQTISQ
jgi:cytochrome b involved in lipid metabolism